MCASQSGPSSPSIGVTDVSMPSLIQFSAVNAAFAVDYSKDLGFEDGVVDYPPPKVAKFNYAPSPSPSLLRNEKHVRNPRSTRRLCMDEPQIDVPTFTNVQVVLVSTPLDFLEAQTAAPKAKMPNYWHSQLFPLGFPCISAFQILGVFGLPSVTHTNPRCYIYLWSLFQTPIYMNVAVHPRLRHWIGEH
jgi:hypothetical protein